MISTKILVPQRRRNVLRRSRLVNLIRRHVDRTLTLISASAGYGKTALLIDFCHNAPPCPVCWFSLDESDRDINNFVNHFVAAIRHQFPNFGEKTRQTLEANPNLGHNPTTLGNVITQDISENISEFFVLVLDDYHVLDTLIPVGELLEVILKYAHSRWHLIVAGRTAPSNLPVILLTAQEQITFIGQEELAFTVVEVQGLMQSRHNVTLTPEQAQELIEVSEGWITGLLLATESLWLGMRDALARVRTQQGPIYAYLATQVFEQQPQALQDTMLTMSTLPEMNEALCQQALGLSGVKHVLQELERRGLFLTTLLDERGIQHYRYHHLFRDFLQTRLQNHDPARFCQLHRRAADWFEAQEDWMHAVLHRLAAGDARATAQTMENGAKPLYLSRRLETLVTWYEKVPASLRPEFPRLLLFVARAMFDLGRADEAMPLLHQAETTFRERGETERTLYTMLQRAVVWRTWGRHNDTLDVAQEVLKLTNLPAPTDEAHRLAGLACLSLGRPEEAVNHLSQSLDLCRELGAVKEIAITYLNLSLALLRLGRLSEGWTCQDKAIELLRQLGPSNYLAMTLNDIACERYYLAGDYKQALSLLREALEVARTASSPRAQAFALLSTADLYRDLGAPKEAQKLYTQAEEIARRSDQAAPITFALLGAAQILIQTGDVVKALG
ncbi:MAG: tetratricopeptide repeat protein, partial [Anaerolineae bacterium]